MAITVKHPFVSTVPDASDTSIVRPSNWNADHTVTGLGTAAELNAGVANGVATLDGSGTVPISQLPAAVLGALSYQGTWNASTNTPTLTSSVGTKGYYYVVNVAGSTDLNGITDWKIGDWAVYNGTAWQKIDNTDAVTSVNGYTGTVVLTQSDIGGTVAIANGGTGQTTATAAFNALAPTQSGNTGKYLTTDGTNSSWATNAGGDVVGPASATDNALARYDTTTGKLIQNSAVIVNDAGTMSGVESLVFDGSIPAATPVGTMWYDGTTETLNFQQNNITQQIGEELFVYGKASAAITDSPLQIIYHTGTVGSSGVITFAPTIAGITDENAIIGVATENIANNGFGRITSFGVVHGITTNGTAFGETWADDDVIWYNPVTGNPTKVKPVAPNIKFQIGTVINAGSGGSGSFQVNLVQGTQLGGTDSNVQITSPTAAQLLTYSTTNGYWKNTSLASGTGISTSTNTNGTLTVTNTAPDQTVSIASGTGISATGTYPAFTVTNTGVTSLAASTGISVSGSTGGVTVTNTAPDQTVVLTAGTGISTSGTYPNFTITNTAPSSGGTVTSVSGTAGRITSTGGTTPVIDLASGVATAGTTGSSTLIPVVTIDTYGRVTGITTAANPQGTVTSVTGTAPVVSSGGATPAISMAAATGSVNGYLTSTDWTTFNGKAPAVTYTTNYVPYGQGTTTPNQSSSYTFDGTTQTAPIQRASNGIVVNSKTVAASYSIASGDCGMSVGPVTVASGQSVTVASGSRWVVL